MATTCERTTPKAVQLPCPCCGEPRANLSLHLADLDGEGAVYCNECNAEFSLGSVRELIGRWTKLLAWIDGTPHFDEQEA